MEIIRIGCITPPWLGGECPVHKPQPPVVVILPAQQAAEGVEALA